MLVGRGRGKIRVPKRSLNNPSDNVDFDSMWNILALSLRQIHTKNASNLSFEELYRTAYKLVLKKKGEALYNNVKAFEQMWLSEEVRSRIRAQLAGGFLAGASRASVGQTGNERRIAGEKFMKALKQAWEDHNLCMNMTTDVLMYMELIGSPLLTLCQDRVYCSDNRKPSIFTACMGLFRDYILLSSLDSTDAKVSSLLNSVLLSQIQMEREGDIIDRNLIRSCVYMLEGLYETDAEVESEKLYLTLFEPDYLQSSREFYKSEAETLLREADAATFLRHIKKRFQEEDDRCRSTISPATAPKIKFVIEEEFIRRHMREVVEMEGSGARYMFDNDRYDELKLLYELISRVDPKKEELCKALYQRVLDLGNDVNKASHAATAAGSGSTRPHDEAVEGEIISKVLGYNTAALLTTGAIKWVEDVLRLKAKCDEIWTRSFDSDHHLQTSLTRSFTDFINAFHRSPEYISLFIDDNLRRGLKGKTETEADEVLEKAIVLLRYVRDKDLFERYYKKHLAKRLLGGRSVSNDVEKQMISKMKLELGNHFTQKLEGMFKDMAVSEDLTASFKTHASQLDDDDDGVTKKIEVGVNVLTSTFWPTDILDPPSHEAGGGSATCIFPLEIEKAKSSFEKFYLNKHTGRRLTWQANAGSADIRAVFPAVPGKDGVLGKQRRHELSVSTYAMVILLLFNDLPRGESFTFTEIQGRTMIPRGDLIRNLQSLAVAPKTRVLIKEPMSKDVKTTDRFFFNESFTSKFLKIKVGVVAGVNKVEGDKERKDTEKRNDEMRGTIIEATIVRIMKGRKQLSHQNLCSEVISQLASRFMPDIIMLKKRIESLIEREYLERIDESATSSSGLSSSERVAAYRYLA